VQSYSSNLSTPATTTAAQAVASENARRAESERAAKASEGPVTGTGLVVVRQWKEGGYWWTEFNNGTKKRGAAVQIAPGAPKKKHTGGVFQAEGGASEGLATLLSGERVLSPGQTREYDAGLLSAVRALVSRLDAGTGSGGNVIVHGDVKLSADYPYDKFVADVTGGMRASRESRGYRTGV
jgi:hypothetical protein